MRREGFVVTDRDVPPVNRPNNPTKCGWCSSVIGEEHETECVTRQRSVVLRLTLEFVSTVPESLDADRIEFIHNGNSFCASSYLSQLATVDEHGVADFGCFCGSPPEDTGLRFVREASDEDEDRMPWAYRWREAR